LCQPLAPPSSKGTFVVVFNSHDIVSGFGLDEYTIFPSLCDLNIPTKNQREFGLEGFRFPHLRRFRFYGHHRDIANPVNPTFPTHLLGQLQSLHSLALMDNRRPENLLRPLGNIPLLVVLELNIAPDLHDFWEGLIWGPDIGRSLVLTLREPDTLVTSTFSST
jgi:hypothetical protein